VNWEKEIRSPHPRYAHFVVEKTALLATGGLKKALSGYKSSIYEFWIKRYYCKNTHRTVSVHPTFSHTRIQFLLFSTIYIIQYWRE